MAVAVCTAGGHAVLADPAGGNPDASKPPQPGDHFVHLTGPKKGAVVKADDLPLGGPQIQAYPADPKTGLVRDGSRLNLVLLARFKPDVLAADTRPLAADGVVAYSGVCTHQGCPVNMWSSDQGVFYCSCHGSMYDPRDGAHVVGGPAPRPLPALGLKMNDGTPVVSESFNARVGATQAHT
ncbi:QcrA and Rieske domain-containing protein [Acidisphaera rubrifaciens]|uniref:QcrA and Rieske domain-containing protein n=1 Tax=Acidisphaera rubrifaciens TaxID=50715 RepID=UPI0006624075|nr:Rieske (2Fe-2S) protein [Acidisphaera rubrifaciens]